MAFQPGERLGPYEIVGLIGKGGMGEVYRATDTRLGRMVAIKTSKREFTDRFEREAKAISALNHPNVCTLHDIGPDYLVMEFVEGETLAKLIEKGPLPLDKALQYATQIVDALAAAHAKGIVHRDLKPGNIIITRNGAKVLDFGLAKLRSAPVATDPSATMETVTEPLTRAGSILGTLYYMAPEQVEGKDAGEHADIFSFGAVLYEMVTGQRAFQGDTQAAVLASIMKDQPTPMAHRQPAVPRALERLVRKCMEKRPEDRWRSAQDLKTGLELIDLDAPPMSSASSSIPITAPIAARPKWIAPTAIAAALIVVAGLAWRFWPKSEAPRSTKFQVQLPEGASFSSYLALSPDAHYLAFSAAGAHPGIWVHDLDALSWRNLPDTGGAGSLYWSPDSKSIAFGAGTDLKRIDLAGGSARTIATNPVAGGLIGSGTWTNSGAILVGIRAAIPMGIFSVPSSGGASTPVTESKTGSDAFPVPLADGKHFLFFNNNPGASYVGYFDGKLQPRPTEKVLDSGIGARYADGKVFFVRNGTLFVQSLDQKTYKLEGDPLPLAEHVGNTAGGGFFTVAPNAFAYRAAAADNLRQFTWFDREGNATGTLVEPQAATGISLSPDGTVVGYRDKGAMSPGDIWALDVKRGVRTKLTFQTQAGIPPVWSPDGSRFAYSGPGLNILLEQASSGAGEPNALYKGDSEIILPTSYSRDGRFLLFGTYSATVPHDQWVLPLDGSKKPTKLLGTSAHEGGGRFSPDGRWLLYGSDESGRSELYVRPFDATGPKLGDGKWQVSRDGFGSAGVFAYVRWRADGKEIVFPGTDGSPMSVDVNFTNAGPQFGTPKRLFALPAGATDWDVTSDGKRFLFAIDPNRTGGIPFTVVLNWKALLKK